MVRIPDPDAIAWQALRDDLKAHVDDLFRDWERITAEEPWMSLPAHHRLDALPKVTRALCDAALPPSGGSADAYRGYASAAAEHGETRRHQGFAQELLFTEHYLLRQAARRYLTRHQLDRAAEAVVRLDVAISVGTRASLMGFHRTEYEARGLWPAVIEEVVRQATVVDG